MHGTVSDAGNAATTGTFGSENDAAVPLGSESNPNEWIYNTAQFVFGKDAGLALATVTDYPESSCYAYVAHDATKRRRPPEHFARTLIHKSDDPRFFVAFMRGCEQPWWREMVRAAEVGRQVIQLTSK